MKKSLRQSISETAADFKANLSPDLTKSQFAKQDFATETHYKPPDILSPGHKRSNTALSPVSPPTSAEDSKIRRARSNTEHIVATKTTFAPSGTMSPGQRVSDEIVTQFASMSTHYKDPVILSPPASRVNTMTSNTTSPRLGQNANISPHFSGSNTSSSRHARKFSFDDGNLLQDPRKNGGHVQDGGESPALSHPPPGPESPRDRNDRVIPDFTGSDTLDNPSASLYDQSNGKSTAPLARKLSYGQMGRGTPALKQRVSYDQIQGTATTLPQNPSLDQIQRGTPAIATILPGPDGRYHADHQKSPEPQKPKVQFPVRSSSLAHRKKAGPKSRVSPAPLHTEFSQPLPPPPPPLPALHVNHNARSAPQDAHAYRNGLRLNPNYGKYDADGRSSYNQSQYSQLPSQINGNADLEKVGTDAYRPPPGVHRDTSNSNVSSSSVPIAMYPYNAQAKSNLEYAQHSPYPTEPQIPAQHDQNQYNNPASQYDQGQNQNQYQLPYGPKQGESDEFDISLYKQPRHDEYGEDDVQGRQRSYSTSSITSSQRAARRLTVWDGANGFTDPGSMAIIEETPGELEKETKKDDKVADEKEFDFSSFLTKLAKN